MRYSAVTGIGILERFGAVYEPVFISWDGMMVMVEGAGTFLEMLMGKKDH